MRMKRPMQQAPAQIAGLRPPGQATTGGARPARPAMGTPEVRPMPGSPMPQRKPPEFNPGMLAGLPQAGIDELRGNPAGMMPTNISGLRPPGPAPTGPMVPVRGGAMAPASVATMMKKGMKKGGSVKSSPAKTMASGGKVSSASKRADGCAIKGKTKGRIV